MSYPKDDEWGDWAHEQRKQKQLDQRLTDLAHSDIDVEIRKAQHMAQVMDSVFALLEPTTHEIDVVCPQCGQRSIRHSRDPRSLGIATEVCNACAGA